MSRGDGHADTSIGECQATAISLTSCSKFQGIIDCGVSKIVPTSIHQQNKRSTFIASKRQPWSRKKETDRAHQRDTDYHKVLRPRKHKYEDAAV